MATPGAMTDAWRDYRRRLRWFFVVWIGGFLGAAVAAYALVSSRFGQHAVSIIGIAWLLALTVVAVRLQLFRCPRCSRQFCKARWYFNPLASHCVHCGLPKGQC